MNIQKDLTPENARARGYEWIQDIMYDEEAPDEAMGEFKEYEKKKYLLGQPASLEAPKNLVGLYKSQKSFTKLLIACGVICLLLSMFFFVYQKKSHLAALSPKLLVPTIMPSATPLISLSPVATDSGVMGVPITSSASAAITTALDKTFGPMVEYSTVNELTLNKTVVSNGSTFTFTGNGFGPNVTALAMINIPGEQMQQMKDLIADGQGNIHGTLFVSKFPKGTYILSVMDITAIKKNFKNIQKTGIFLTPQTHIAGALITVQ